MSKFKTQHGHTSPTYFSSCQVISWAQIFMWCLGASSRGHSDVKFSIDSPRTRVCGRNNRRRVHNQGRCAAARLLLLKMKVSMFFKAGRKGSIYAAPYRRLSVLSINNPPEPRAWNWSNRGRAGSVLRLYGKAPKPRYRRQKQQAGHMLLRAWPAAERWFMQWLMEVWRAWWCYQRLKARGRLQTRKSLEGTEVNWYSIETCTLYCVHFKF